jgi:DNA-binding CsgD family transcriptional regulator
MPNLRPVDSLPLSAAVLQAYEYVMKAVGSDAFAGRVTRAVERLAHVDRLYLFELRGNPVKVRSLVQMYEPGKPRVEHSTYVRHYLPIDPIQRVISAGASHEGMVEIRVQPRDIVATGYRRMLEHAGILERVSYLRRAQSGWQCMTVARRSRNGPFNDADLAALGSFAGLLMPMISRNEALTEGAPASGKDAIDDIEARFGRRFPELTGRERQACARAVVGMTVEGAAKDLGVALSSVHTYRKRAYRRLGVASAAELARLVMR